MIVFNWVEQHYTVLYVLTPFAYVAGVLWAKRHVKRKK
jgi:hypothetical protein